MLQNNFAVSDMLTGAVKNTNAHVSHRNRKRSMSHQRPSSSFDDVTERAAGIWFVEAPTVTMEWQTFREVNFWFPIFVCVVYNVPLVC